MIKLDITKPMFSSAGIITVVTVSANPNDIAYEVTDGKRVWWVDEYGIPTDPNLEGSGLVIFNYDYEPRMKRGKNDSCINGAEISAVWIDENI